MDQLILEFSEPPAPTLDNFVVGRNAELLGVLRRVYARTSPDRLIYLWGEVGCGRTHLLSAISGRAESVSGEMQLHIADDVDTLDAEGARALFGVALQVLAGDGFLVASGDAPPASLKLRDDLRSRLGAGLVFRVLPLSDEEKLAALAERAAHLGFHLPEDAGNYLLRHCARDMPSLLSTLDALDRMSVKLKRPVTLALLRACLQERE